MIIKKMCVYHTVPYDDGKIKFKDVDLDQTSFPMWLIFHELINDFLAYTYNETHKK